MTTEFAEIEGSHVNFLGNRFKGCKQVVNKFQGEHKSWIPREKNSYTRPVKISVIVLLVIPVLIILVWHEQCLSFSFLGKPGRYSLQKKKNQTSLKS